MVKLVKKCLDGKAPSYFSNYFQLRTHDIHDYDTRNKNKLVIDRIKLESTKRAFFIREQVFLMIIYNLEFIYYF